MEYVTGEKFLKAVDELNQYIDKRANAPLLVVIQSEVRAYGDALRLELHERLEKVVKETETERLQTMSELERRITKSIAENERQDKIRGKWLKGVAIITLVNLIAVATLVVMKVKGM